MPESLDALYEEEWVIWNGNNGLLTTVNIGQIEDAADGRLAWLDEPFDMVGPFSLEELQTEGCIAFAECLVMSRQRWQDDQLELRRESHKIRGAAEARAREKVERMGANSAGRFGKRKPFNEKEYRKTLDLPLDGSLEAKQVNAAFRKLAQKAHPDAGGSNDEFVRITKARDALLECIV